MKSLSLLVVVAVVTDLISLTHAWVAHSRLATSTSTSSSTTVLFAGYEPKWKKKATLADTLGASATIDPTQVGLKGTIPVVFMQGNETRTTMAWPGQSVRDVASQAGQFIRYGCGKGECGTCECLVNGQWMRPCVAAVPPTAAGETFTVVVKQIKNKAKSSGKFYSARSFVMGFYNNLLGMIGFVKERRAARNNWKERQDYEALVRQRALEKKQSRSSTGAAH
jgi:ferredoxin